MIGFTAPIPLEPLIAAGRQPVDLRQLFLSNEAPRELIEEAELAGFDDSCDPWLKGMYGCILRHGIREVVAVTNNQPGIDDLVSILTLHDVRVIPFSYPLDRSAESLALEIKKLARHFGAAPVEIDHVRQQLNLIRAKIGQTALQFGNQWSGPCRDILELQLAAFDMQGDPDAFDRQVENFRNRKPAPAPHGPRLRLACLGEIPLCSNLYETLEEQGATITYLEQGTQACLPGPSDSLVEQYLNLTLPYGVFLRCDHCRKDLEDAPVDGIIFINGTGPSARLHEMLLRQRFQLPLLTLSNHRPGELDAASRTQLERFLAELPGAE